MSTRGAAGLSGRRILLTGADGYIGTTLLSLLRDVDCHVRAIVPPVPASSPLIPIEALGPKSLEVVEGDVRTVEDFGPWLAEIDVVVHLAAQTSHYEANAHPAEDYAINVAPLVRLLEWCRGHEARPRIVFASSATVVGLPKVLPVDELSPCFPVTVYDIHKLSGEHYLSFFAREHGIPSCSLRLANVYGPGLVTTRPDRGILNLMVRRAIAGEDLTVFGTGTWLRDYVHLTDVADAFLRAAGAPVDQISGRTFNVCTGTGTRFCDMLSMIAEEAAAMYGKRSRIVHVDKVLSPIDERSYVGNPAALRAATGWSPQIDLRAGVLELLTQGRPS